MVSEVLIGFAVTAVALFAMLAWSYHEIARIDEIREQVDEDLAERAEAKAREEE